MGILSRLFKKDGYYNSDQVRIVFHCEQTGEVENEITSLWSKSLKEYPEIKEAYLAVTTIKRNDGPHPTLCLFAEDNVETDKQKIISTLSEDFKSLFNANQFLDIIYLTNEMRSDCNEVCPPFYTKK